MIKLSEDWHIGRTGYRGAVGKVCFIHSTCHVRQWSDTSGYHFTLIKERGELNCSSCGSLREPITSEILSKGKLLGALIPTE